MPLLRAGCVVVYVPDERDVARRLAKKAYREYFTLAGGSGCEICGVEKAFVFDVHHIDKNPDNNNISNLQLLCRSCHMLCHSNLHSELFLRENLE
jgi:hypothetical protein